MDEMIFCAVKGYKVEESVCSGIIMKADAATIQTCRTCPRGAALARTSSVEIKQLDPAAVAAFAASTQPTNIESLGPVQPAKNRAWELIVERTGCASQEKLAKKIGGTYQSKISQIMVKLGKGVTPSGREWNRLLEISGLMPEELLLAAGHLPSATAPAESSPASPSPAVASSPLTPSGPVASSSGPGGPASVHGEPLVGVADMPLLGKPEGPHEVGISHAGVKSGLGSESAEVLSDAKESLPLARISLTAWPAASPPVDHAPDAIPDDFLAYTGQRPVLHGKPALHIKTSGDMELSVDAVALGGLEHAGHVRPFWSDQRKQIGLAPVDATGPGVLKLQVTPSKRRRISASGFLNGFGIRPAPGTYPMERHPSGMLVATITQQPAQSGGEA